MLAAVAAVVDRARGERERTWRGASAPVRYRSYSELVAPDDSKVVMLNREPVALTVTGQDPPFTVTAGGRKIAHRDRLVAGRAAAACPGRRSGGRGADRCGGLGWRLIHEGGQAEALVLTPRQAELYALMPVKAAPDTSKFLLSPMPGLLASVAVSEGQEIKTGEVLAVVEAMKMENVLRATRDGTVKTLHAAAGDSLRVDQKIIEFA